ncbi:MAG: DUF4038 domain-containing protein [Geitlerinemataceae cyanobacterium]
MVSIPSRSQFPTGLPSTSSPMLRMILQRSGLSIVIALFSSAALGCREPLAEGERQAVEPRNAAPVVRAGADLTVTPATPVKLLGTVSDDGFTPSVAIEWKQVGGPAKVAFDNANTATPTARFPAAGTYTLQLTANDGETATDDEVQIIVNPTGNIQVPSLGIFDRTFTHTGSYPNPYTEVTATATLTRPDGQILTIPLFWDGDTTWRMRVSPDVAGNWQWLVSSTDAGLNGQSGTFTVVASDNRGGIRVRSQFPYHFETQDGTPFWFFGDTNWNLFGIDAAENLSRETIEHYLDVRASQGFNYIHANLLSTETNEGGKAFTNFDTETINPAFWQEVDSRIESINRRGITAMLILAWGKDGKVGDWAGFPNDEARQRYAQYIVARYSAYNVAFNVGAEWNEFADASMYRDLASIVVRNDPHDRLIAIHPGESAYSVRQFAPENWMSFGDYQQNYRQLHDRILEARDRNKPVVNSEYAYYLRDQNGDGQVDKPNSKTLEEIRHASWDITMAGGYLVTGWGTTYFGGRRDRGVFNVDAPKNDDWEEQVQYLPKLFTRLKWWKLEPEDSLLESQGTGYVLAEPGRQYVVYVRDTDRPVSLDLREQGRYRVKLFDPRSGTETPQADITGGGKVSLTPPDRQDWVFVVISNP